MSADPPRWHELTHAARNVLEDAGGASVSEPLAEWPTLGKASSIAPSTLAVVRYLPQAAQAAPAGSLRALATLVHQVAPAFAWRQTYRAPEVSVQFLERYGWCELFGLGGPLRCASMACGFLLLGPHTLYPAHSHRAMEWYVPLSGHAEWYRGDQGVMRAPGELITHASFEPHAMRTLAEPLLALYVWRGAGLAEPAQLQQS